MFKEIKRTYNKKSMTWTVVLFLVITGTSFFFKETASDPTLNIAMLYTLGIFIIARHTEGYLYGFVLTVASVLSVNYFFTYPYSQFNFNLKGYNVTFIGMIAIGLATSTLSTHLRDRERKLVEQEKAFAEQEKRIMGAEKEKMRANLLRAVSHDLRTPLTGIIGNSSSYLAREKELSNEEKKAMVSDINSDAKWLLNLVENLLSITRINDGAARVKKSLEAVDEIVSAAVIQFKKRYPEGSVKVKVPDKLVMAMMDALLIQQVIINILQNAQVHSGSQDPIELTVEEDKSNVVFRFRDYGVGIRQDKLKTIFDGEGHRNERAKTDGHKGIGIGLSICKTIILAHGGEIYARNHEKGAEFIFTLKKEEEDDKSSDNRR